MAGNRDEANIYIIPKNFLDSGYVFGGRFKTRNFIEGIVVALPIVGVFYFGWKFLGWSVQNTLAYCIILAGGVFLLATSGVNGDSLFEFIARVQRFRSSKRISKYNPRVKMEAEPDYLMHEKGVLPKEKLMELVNGMGDAFLGNDGPVSQDINDERLIVYFADDEGYVEKPTPLKTKAELKADAKAAKKAAKKQAKEDRAYIRSLPRGERAAKRKELRLAAKAKDAKEKQLRYEEEEKINARVKETLERAEKAKNAAYLDQKQKEKEAKLAAKERRLSEKASKRKAFQKEAVCPEETVQFKAVDVVEETRNIETETEPLLPTAEDAKPEEISVLMFSDETPIAMTVPVPEAEKSVEELPDKEPVLTIAVVEEATLLEAAPENKPNDEAVSEILVELGYDGIGEKIDPVALVEQTESAIAEILNCEFVPSEDASGEKKERQSSKDACAETPPVEKKPSRKASVAPKAFGFAAKQARFAVKRDE